MLIAAVEALTFEQVTQLGMVGIVLLVQGVIAKLFMKMWTVFRAEEAKRTDAVLSSCERIVQTSSVMANTLQETIFEAKSVTNDLKELRGG